jgi:hypothetical protein
LYTTAPILWAQMYYRLICKHGMTNSLLILVWTAASQFQARERDILFSTAFRQALGPTKPHIQCVPEAVSSAVKRQGRVSDHSSPLWAEVELYLHSAICFHGIVFNYTIKYTDNFFYILSQELKLSPLGTAATNWPILPALDDR